jgi:transposase InsO family protein
MHPSLLDKTGLARSRSRASNCYDNAKIESLWSKLKNENSMDVVVPATRLKAELAVFDYTETFITLSGATAISV